MSCQPCELLQKQVFEGNFDRMTYIRVGHANVLIVACPEHFAEVACIIRYVLRSGVTDESHNDDQRGESLLEEAFPGRAPAPSPPPEDSQSAVQEDGPGGGGR